MKDRSGIGLTPMHRPAPNGDAIPSGVALEQHGDVRRRRGCAARGRGRRAGAWKPGTRPIARDSKLDASGACGRDDFDWWLGRVGSTLALNTVSAPHSEAFPTWTCGNPFGNPRGVTAHGRTDWSDGGPDVACGDGRPGMARMGFVELSRWRHGFESRWGCSVVAGHQCCGSMLVAAEQRSRADMGLPKVANLWELLWEQARDSREGRLA